MHILEHVITHQFHLMYTYIAHDSSMFRVITIINPATITFLTSDCKFLKCFNILETVLL